MIAKLQYETKKPSDRSARALLNERDGTYVEDSFRSGLPAGGHVERHLRGVVDDTLSNPGSLARAQLAFSLMKTLGYDDASSRDIGVAIEYFHTASLLFDDLPCMDNAQTRRGLACPHTVHGESAAILGALSLINQGYALLWSVLGRIPEANRLASAALVKECLGLNGILNGQAYDLHFGESQRKKEDVLRIANGKTVTLIRLTLLLPAMVHGVAEPGLRLLENLATSWGLAYQILDDFKDVLMESSETGKTSARDQQLDHPNLPLTIGFRAAEQELARLLDDSHAAIQRLLRHLPDVDTLERLQHLLETEQQNVVSRVGAAAQRHRPVVA